MGKVYDALRRAEAQRAERGTRVAPPAVLDPAGAFGPAARPARPGRWRRLLAWLRSSTSPGAEEAEGVNKRRITLLQPDSFVAEQFRSLRARLDSLAAQRPMRTLAVTSALPAEGKTTAAVNLAVVSSMGVDRRIVLVDCDLRKPKVHTAFGLRPEGGLAEVLTGSTSLERAILRVEGTNLAVLPVRGMPSNPSELLASDAMRKLVEELARSYDQVILDTPPALALPDAKTVSELVDGVVLVVRASTTPREDVEAALDVLDRRRIVGLVLNGAETETSRYVY